MELEKEDRMSLFIHCKNCGHIKEDHAIDAPEGEQECLAEGCDCPNFEPEEDEREKVPA